MIFVPKADGSIRLNTSESGFEDGYDRLVYIGTHFPSTLVVFVRRWADVSEYVKNPPAKHGHFNAGIDLPGCAPPRPPLSSRWSPRS